ncbi:hypothetical protein EK0264_11940 [Epidermidibacterium keratini]|uniref:Uncharacterized protein n=1 Tax=Epidermidibacterium keratini TaxID=1891644 RepID=A0A7L4YNT4_9ACTN|nr:hypothetical protein [Epidermidibacterium keratini]QHC00925.1 hypothetical protein EK0264_11940 [Epidermidibacterium keratini]
MEDDQLRALRTENRLLAARLLRLEQLLFRTTAILASAALIAGPFLPYLMAADPDPDEDSSISLVRSVIALPDSGGGPYESEAMVVGVLMGIFVLCTAVTLISMLVYASSNTERARFVTRVAAGILLAGSSSAWLLVLLLAEQWSPRVSNFSPASLVIGIGAVLTLVAAAIRPDPE